MANILQVTNPSPSTDNRILDNQEARNRLNGQRIRDSVDPTRVVKADGQEGGKTGIAAGEGRYSIIDYESNYSALIQRLGDGVELPRLLEQLLFGDRTGVPFAGQEEAGALVEQLFSSIQVGSPETLRKSLMEQQVQQTKLSGPFFADLRSLLTRGTPGNLRNAVMAFTRGFNDYSSGRHPLQQVHSLTRDISQLMLKNYKTDFRQLMDEMDWKAESGGTAANTAVLSGWSIPFLSSYISQTHDYGTIREAVMLFILHAAKYENGQEDRLMQLFERMTGNREFERLFAGDTRDRFASAPEGLDQRSGSFAGMFSALVLKETNGQAGIENIQPFYSILNSALLSESVYLPLLRILAPFCYQGKDVISEIQADPDAGSQEENGRRIKMLFKFHIQGLGRFDVALTLQDRRVEMQLCVPPSLAEKAEIIQSGIAEILKKNGMDLNRLLVREKAGDIRLEAIFPGI